MSSVKHSLPLSYKSCTLFSAMMMSFTLSETAYMLIVLGNLCTRPIQKAVLLSTPSLCSLPLSLYISGSVSCAPRRSSLPVVLSTLWQRLPSPVWTTTPYLVLMLYPLSLEMPTSCPDPLLAPSLLPCPKLMFSTLSCSLVLQPPWQNVCLSVCSWSSFLFSPCMLLFCR